MKRKLTVTFLLVILSLGNTFYLYTQLNTSILQIFPRDFWLPDFSSLIHKVLTANIHVVHSISNGKLEWEKRPAWNKGILHDCEKAKKSSSWSLKFSATLIVAWNLIIFPQKPPVTLAQKLKSVNFLFAYFIP